MENDGACLFRSVSDQLLGDQNKNDIVRKQCMDYVVSRYLLDFLFLFKLFRLNLY